jgi:hypothetical protein
MSAISEKAAAERAVESLKAEGVMQPGSDEPALQPIPPGSAGSRIQ